ncbi:hypothetical protein ACFL5A_04040, partial [Gemmatimonadota bacterium]
MTDEVSFLGRGTPLLLGLALGVLFFSSCARDQRREGPTRVAVLAFAPSSVGWLRPDVLFGPTMPPRGTRSSIVYSGPVAGDSLPYPESVAWTMDYLVSTALWNSPGIEFLWVSRDTLVETTRAGIQLGGGLLARRSPVSLVDSIGADVLLTGSVTGTGTEPMLEVLLYDARTRSTSTQLYPIGPGSLDASFLRILEDVSGQVGSVGPSEVREVLAIRGMPDDLETIRRYWSSLAKGFEGPFPFSDLIRESPDFSAAWVDWKWYVWNEANWGDMNLLLTGPTPFSDPIDVLTSEAVRAYRMDPGEYLSGEFLNLALSLKGLRNLRAAYLLSEGDQSELRSAALSEGCIDLAIVCSEGPVGGSYLKEILTLGLLEEARNDELPVPLDPSWLRPTYQVEVMGFFDDPLIEFAILEGEADSIAAAWRRSRQASETDPGAPRYDEALQGNQYRSSILSVAIQSGRFDLLAGLDLGPSGTENQFWEGERQRLLLGAGLLHQPGATAAQKGRGTEILEELRQDLLGRLPMRSGASLYHLAQAASALGHMEEAASAFESAVENGFRRHGFAELNPLLNNIRDHPRFQAAMDRMEEDLRMTKARYLALPEGPTEARVGAALAG